MEIAGGERGSTRLAWCEVWLQHALRKAGGEPEKLWLVVDWPADAAEPYHYYLAHLPRAPTKARCLALSCSRRHIEQCFRRAKEYLGLDHFEGRSWTGFHHHLVLSALDCLFILAVHSRAKKTSGVTGEQTLRASRTSLVRSTGSCFCFGSKFDDVVVILT